MLNYANAKLRRARNLLYCRTRQNSPGTRSGGALAPPLSLTKAATLLLFLQVQHGADQITNVALPGFLNYPFTIKNLQLVIAYATYEVSNSKSAWSFFNFTQNDFLNQPYAFILNLNLSVFLFL